MMTQTEHYYIVKDNGILGGEPVVKGTRTPVRAVVEMWRMGETPEDIVRGLPHLSLAAVFDALSYYLDHQQIIDSYILANHVPPELTRYG